MLADGGCRVDRATKMVRIPPHVVEDAVRSAPPTLVLHGRDRARDVVIERGRSVFTSFGEGIFVIDPFTGERREPRKDDVAASAAVGRCPRRARRLQSCARRPRRSPSGRRPAYRRRDPAQHDQARLPRPPERVHRGAHGGPASGHPGVRGCRPRAPPGHLHGVPREPAQAGPRLLRGHPHGRSQRCRRSMWCPWPWPAARRRSRSPARW